MAERAGHERVYDEDRLTGRRLTLEEQEALRRRFKEAAEICRKHFRDHPL